MGTAVKTGKVKSRIPNLVVVNQVVQCSVVLQILIRENIVSNYSDGRNTIVARHGVNKRRLKKMLEEKYKGANKK